MDNLAEGRAYYQFYRDEIRREDEITHNRLIASITFQGLLTAAMGFLVSGSWATPAPGPATGIMEFRVDVIGGLGAIGIIVSTLSCFGIWATRLSIEATKEAYERVSSELDEGFMCPQIHGTGLPFHMGNFYTKYIPLTFTALWSIYMMSFLARTGRTSWDVSIASGIAFNILLYVILQYLQRRSRKASRTLLLAHAPKQTEWLAGLKARAGRPSGS